MNGANPGDVYGSKHRSVVLQVRHKETTMRVPIVHLQKFAIFTTALTGAGVGTMYYLLQKRFSRSAWHRLAVRKLEACPVAMKSLGAPPLKVSNIHLTDRHNRVDQDTAQIKIYVAGSKTGGCLYTTSIRDSNTSSWSLEQAVLRLREGPTIDLLSPAAAAPVQTQGPASDH